MGLDFIRRAAATYRKSLDRHRVDLATPTLFTQEPGQAPRAYAASTHSGKGVKAGDKLCVRLVDECVLAFRGLDPVATFNSPTAELIEAIVQSSGEACGTVEQVHDAAQIAEITIC